MNNEERIITPAEDQSFLIISDPSNAEIDPLLLERLRASIGNLERSIDNITQLTHTDQENFGPVTSPNVEINRRNYSLLSLDPPFLLCEINIVSDINLILRRREVDVYVFLTHYGTNHRIDISVHSLNTSMTVFHEKVMLVNKGQGTLTLIIHNHVCGDKTKLLKSFRKRELSIIADGPDIMIL